MRVDGQLRVLNTCIEHDRTRGSLQHDMPHLSISMTRKYNDIRNICVCVDVCMCIMLMAWRFLTLATFFVEKQDAFVILFLLSRLVILFHII